MPKFRLDDSPIQWVGWTTDNGYETLEIGTHGVTKITHREMFCGENSIHWLEVWKGERVAARFNVANVDCIHYDEVFNDVE